MSVMSPAYSVYLPHPSSFSLVDPWLTGAPGGWGSSQLHPLQQERHPTKLEVAKLPLAPEGRKVLRDDSW